jgi:hypothetical protein
MFALPIRGYHPLRPCFPDRFWLSHIHDWPDPRSLATTSGVSVDVLSSRYLDVSVPWVCLKPPMYSEVSYLLLITGNPKPQHLRASIWLQTSLLEHQNIASPDLKSVNTRSWSSGYRRWVSPFGNPWIKASSQLPTAYRSVARPSSPLSAKASTEHP